MKYADAFCGLGGFSLALKAVVPEAECVWAADINKTAAECFKSNFNIEAYKDIRLVNKKQIPDFDFLFGGFPCQPFSRNGKWYNKNERIVAPSEDRDNLFLELIDILQEKNPKYFIFENVAGLTKMKNTDGTLYYDLIMSNLKECNYNVYSEVLDSADHGLPQQRKRIFFVGVRKDISSGFYFPEKQKRTLAIKDVLEPEVLDYFYLKNLWKNRKIKLAATRQNAPAANHPFNRGASRLEALSFIYNNAIKPSRVTGKIESVAVLYGDTPSGLPRQQDKIYSINGISPTIATFSTPCIHDGKDFRQLTSRECARLQGIPDWYKLPKSLGKAYFVIGNAVSVPVVKKVIENILKF